MKNVKKIISVLSAAALSCAMIGCGPTEPPPHTHTYSDGWAYSDTHHYHETTCGHDIKPEDSDGYAMHTLVNGKCSVCDYVQPLTLNEFVTEHKSAATDFIKNKIRPSVIGNKEAKAESAYIVENSADALSEVNIVWTYSVDETYRQVEWANVTLPAPVPFRNIANGNYTINADELDIDRTGIFAFDARTNYNKQNIATALYAKANVAADVKLYTEIQSSDASYRSFNLLDLSDGKITVTQINVLKGDGTQKVLLQNINRPSTKTSVYSERDIGTNIYGSSYALEDLGPETEQPTPPDPIDPDNPDPEEPEQPITNAEIIAALEEYCLDTLLENCYTFEANTALIENNAWYINTNTNKEITSAEYVFNYKRTDNVAYFTVGKIEFTSAMSAQDLKNGKIGTPTYSRPYRFDYNPTIQEARAKLTNAICDKLFGENEGATRFMGKILSWLDSDLHQSKSFQVCQISEKQIKNQTIAISYIGPDGYDNVRTDEDFINQLSYTNKYKAIGVGEHYQICGVKVENNDSPFAAN